MILLWITCFHYFRLLHVWNCCTSTSIQSPRKFKHEPYFMASYHLATVGAYEIYLQHELHSNIKSIHNSFYQSGYGWTNQQDKQILHFSSPNCIFLHIVSIFFSEKDQSNKFLSKYWKCLLQSCMMCLSCQSCNWVYRKQIIKSMLRKNPEHRPTVSSSSL